MSPLRWVMVIFVAKLPALSAQTCAVSQDSSVITSALFKSLVASQNRDVRPIVQVGAPAIIELRLSLLSFYRDRVNCGVFTISGLIDLKWNDSRLAWDPDQYNGIHKIRLPSDLIWLPDVVVYNTFGFRESAYPSTVYNAVVYSTGLVNLFLPVTANVYASTTTGSDGLDVVTFMQQFASWTYDISELSFRTEGSNVPSFETFYDSSGTEEYDYIASVAETGAVQTFTSPVPFATVTLLQQFRSRKPVVSSTSTCTAR